MSAVSHGERLTETVQALACRRCGAPLLAALDGPIASIPVRCDPVVLTPPDELAALLAGRMTYELIPSGTTAQRIRWRSPEVIRGATGYPVFAEHVCTRSR